MAEMTPARKRIAMLIVLVGSSLIAERVVSLVGADGDVVEPRASGAAAPRMRARATAATSPSAPDTAPAGLLRLDRLLDRQRRLDANAGQPETADAASPFDSVPLPAAAAAVVAPVVPPRPTVPPFPYAYMGGLSEDGVRTAFFTQGDRVLPVKAGDTVDAVYRVDQMTEKQMKLTYLPLNASLVLALGGAR